MSAAASPAADINSADREVSYRFCQDCANLLYPKENRTTNQLFFVCKACHRVESHNVSCIYRNNIGGSATDTAGVTTDVASDPTVGSPEFCTLCGDQMQCSSCGEGAAGALGDSESSESGSD